jgi:ribosome biogenesis GTPase
MAVKEISKDDSRGRHTATHRRLILLSSGAMVIDTPGMRELGMWDVSAGLGEAANSPTAAISPKPGCAVKAALENGELSAERWQSFLTLKHEAKYSEGRAGFMRERQQWHKQLAKWSKQNQKNGG